jgi:hypothetical protein
VDCAFELLLLVLVKDALVQCWPAVRAKQLLNCPPGSCFSPTRSLPGRSDLLGVFDVCFEVDLLVDCLEINFAQ